MKPVQYFTDEYLERCKSFSDEAIIEYLENFRLLQASNDKSILISLKVPESLLKNFRVRAELNGVKYQTQIKSLMFEWVNSMNRKQ